MIPQQIRNNEGFYSINDIARIAGLKHWRIHYLIEHKLIEKPNREYRSNKRRYYNAEDKNRILKKIQRQEP